MTALDWFRTVAATLGDDEPGRPFQRYPLEDLVAAFNRAQAIISTYRPDLYTEYLDVEMQPGKYQDFRGCCANVLDVVEQVDGEGNIVKPVSGARPKTSKTKTIWNKPSCLPPVDAEGVEFPYVLEDASIDPNMNGRFTVEPPVPCDVKAYVRVKCVTPPCHFYATEVMGELPFSSAHATASWHYVLASMLAGDRHAAGATNEMAFHYRMFNDLIGIEIRHEALIESKEQA